MTDAQKAVGKKSDDAQLQSHVRVAPQNVRVDMIHNNRRIKFDSSDFVPSNLIRIVWKKSFFRNHHLNYPIRSAFMWYVTVYHH